MERTLTFKIKFMPNYKTGIGAVSNGTYVWDNDARSCGFIRYNCSDKSFDKFSSERIGTGSIKDIKDASSAQIAALEQSIQTGKLVLPFEPIVSDSINQFYEPY
jgi:hypothetical protein